MDIVFIRHCRTVMNNEGRYCGVTDLDICPEGISEAQSTIEQIKKIPFDAVYTSPLKRAVHTVQLITDQYMVDNRLKEINFGIFEGLTYEEILREYPTENEKWQQDFINYCIPGGESLQQLYRRTEDFLKNVDKNCTRVLAVTHGGVIRCALASVFGSSEYFYKFQVKHGMLTVIAVEDGYMYVKVINGYLD